MSKKRLSPHDRFIKSMMTDPKVVKEFFEVNLPESIKAVTDLSSLKLQKDSFIDDKLRLQMADVLFETKFNGESGFLYLLLEHQSTPQKLLPFRILKYITAIQEAHLEKTKSKTIPFVFPLVLYTGSKPYPYSMDLFDLYGSNKQLAKETLSNPYQLIDLTKLPDEELQKYIWFGTMCLLAKHIHDADLLPFFMDVLSKMLSTLDSLGEEGYIIKCVSYIYEAGDVSDRQEFMKTLTQTLETIDKDKIMTIAEQLRLEGRLEGKLEGMQQGKLEGMQQGMQKGIEKAALGMIQKGMPLSEIASIVDLPLSEIVKLQKTIH